MSYKDITGNMYGYLQPIKRLNKRKRTFAIWECKCTLCGRICEKSLEDLKTAKSCGCYRRKIMSRRGEERLKDRGSRKGISNTGSILREAPNRNNKSGIRGVSWSKSKEKWIAQIMVNRKHYVLGRFKNIEDAAEIRKKAEEAVKENKFDEFIRECH